ncbi:MAG TPA: AI-2E family transporter [Baekduia sp.]|nr:AI-2E family transporter [Baekduia sp.]
MARDVPARTILRVVVIVVLSALALYLIYLLRKPIGWLFLATFIAIAVSGPINRLSQRMPRGLAIAAVYVGLLLAPVALGLLVIPNLVTEATSLADDVPRYATDVREFIRDNETLRDLDEKYELGAQLESQAAKLPEKLGDAATVLSDLGLGLVNSVFALVNILILSVFIVAGGRGWIHAALSTRTPDERERIERTLTRVSSAVGGYVQGALTIALIAGISGFIVMSILGVPFAAPLAVLTGLFSLIPLIGATIAAIIVGVVTLFNDFPTATIAWIIWAVVYQQVENNLIQPQVQKRTVQVQPIVVLVAVLFGSTLLGVVGALLAIPVAASLQIGLHEYLDWRRSRTQEVVPVATPPAPPPAGAGA